MKNSGFTLIELIIVIAIMGLLGTIITVSLTKTLQSTKTRQCEDFIKEIEEAACVYVGLSDTAVVCDRTDGCNIMLTDLISEGLIDSEDENESYESCKVNVSTNYVNVSWVNNEKICEYK